MTKENYFIKLNAIDVKDKIEKKNNLSYLSWAWAWGEVKKIHPDATYTIYENKDGLFYHHDNQTAWVKTGVTVNGIEHIEYLPVMDYRNSSIPVAKVTSFDVNKAIQRSLTKAIARHGLGLYIYAGEDLPEANEAQKLGDTLSMKPDRLDQERMRDTAITMLNACATVEKLQEVGKKYKNAWGKLDADLADEVRACYSHNLEELKKGI